MGDRSRVGRGAAALRLCITSLSLLGVTACETLEAFNQRRTLNAEQRRLDASPPEPSDSVKSFFNEARKDGKLLTFALNGPGGARAMVIRYLSGVPGAALVDGGRSSYLISIAIHQGVESFVSQQPAMVPFGRPMWVNVPSAIVTVRARVEFAQLEASGSAAVIMLGEGTAAVETQQGGGYMDAAADMAAQAAVNRALRSVR